MYKGRYFQLVFLNQEIPEISKHLNIFGTTAQYYNPGYATDYFRLSTSIP